MILLSTIYSDLSDPILRAFTGYLTNCYETDALGSDQFFKNYGHISFLCKQMDILLGKFYIVGRSHLNTNIFDLIQ